MLEEAIKENTNAIRELIVAIGKGIPTTAAQVAAVVAESPKQEEASAKKEQTKPVQKEATATAQPTAQAADAPEQKAAPSVKFDDLKTQFLDLVNTNREKAVGILSGFGLSKLSEAKPEQYGEIFAAVQGS